MAQVLEFKLPDLGEGLTEAEIVRWLVAVGDVVAVDQPVVEVETAKAMVEVPCPYGGVVTARYGEEGTELPVGAPLLTVAVGGTGGPGPAPAVEQGAGAAAEPTGTAASAESAVSSEYSGNVLVGYGTAGPAARRRRVRQTAPAAPPHRSRPPPPRLLPPDRDPCPSSPRSCGSWPGTGGSTCGGCAGPGPRG